MPRSRIRLLPLLGSLTLLLVADSVVAKPAHKKALAEFFGPALAAKLNDCHTCHLPDVPVAPESSDKPHNLFGKRLVEVRETLRKTGKKDDIAARLLSVANEDADGDGVSNL